MEYIQSDGLEFLSTVSNDGVDLVLTDPPYITSRKTGMNAQMDIVKKVETTGEKSFFLNTNNIGKRVENQVVSIGTVFSTH